MINICAITNKEGINNTGTAIKKYTIKKGVNKERKRDKYSINNKLLYVFLLFSKNISKPNEKYALFLINFLFILFKIL